MMVNPVIVAVIYGLVSAASWGSGILQVVSPLNQAVYWVYSSLVILLVSFFYLYVHYGLEAQCRIYSLLQQGHWQELPV